jgi:RHS repeat-associated protein
MSGRIDSILEWTYERDEQGRLARLTSPSGRLTAYEYVPWPARQDAIQREIRRSDDGEIVIDYDLHGRRTSVNSGSLHVAYRWNAYGQLLTLERSDSATIEYRYDTLRRLAGYRLGPGVSIDYGYDFLGRLASITTPAGRIGFDYHTGSGRTMRHLPNGVVSVWEREANGRLTRIEHADGNRHLLGRFDYSYRPDGLIAHIVEWSPLGERRTEFEYDAVQRLVGETDSAGRRWRAEYDELGNRTGEWFDGALSADYQADWANRLLSVGATACEHDEEGNLISVRLGDRPYAFTFDARNALQFVNSGEVEYEHDHDGCLVARTYRGNRTMFVPNPLTTDWQPLAADGRAGQRLYLWDGRMPLAEFGAADARFFLEDHLGSVRCIVNHAGEVVERRDYSAFGVCTSVDDPGGIVPGFAGLLWDPAARVYLTRTRAYAPELGRFLQLDPDHRVPLGSQKDLSWYVYCGNDPVNFTDRGGSRPEEAGGQHHRKATPEGASVSAGSEMGPGGGHIGSATSTSGAPQSRQLPETTAVADFINNIHGHFKWVLITGMGSGSEPRVVLLERAAGRFQLIDTTGSGSKGATGDLASYVVVGALDSATLQPQVTDYTAEVAYHFSAGGHLIVAGRGRDIFADPSNQRGLSRSSIRSRNRGVVYDLTGPQLGAIGNTPAIKVSGRASGPVGALADSLFKTFDFIVGGGQVVSRFAQGRSPFDTHDLEAYLEADADLLPPPGTYGTVQVKTREGVFTYVFDETARSWTQVGSRRSTVYQPADPAQATVDPATPVADARSAPAVAPLAAATVHTQSIPFHQWTAKEQQDYFESRKRATQVGAGAPRDGEMGGGPDDDSSGGASDVTRGPGPRTPAPPTWRYYIPRLRPRWVNEIFALFFPRWLASLITEEPPGRDAMPIPVESAPGPGAPAVSPLAPSPVGGVYLGGANRLLEGLGQLRGVALDRSNGHLVLLTDRGSDVPLPPFRLDDIVIVFRSVYQHGEAPSVTIDPRGDDPHGPVMDVKHGTATPDSYVGWVLFEADRLMKGYNTGRDNNTGAPVSSAITGHDAVLDAIYFGGDFADGRTDGNWERFWIVPAESRSFGDTMGQASLVDVPLKIKTQRMAWRNGKLEDDPRGRSSRGATAFVEWFTQNYDSIAGERYLVPPPETGLTAPAPVFAELRRIAAMTAVAERLRAQGIPMPAWMRDHRVTPIPVPKTTPSVSIEKTCDKGTRRLTASIYGGVNLAPADAAVKHFDRTSSTWRLPSAEKKHLVERLVEVEAVGQEASRAAQAQTPLTPFPLVAGGGSLTAVTLPGSDTKAVLPCRLAETDLEVTTSRGAWLALTRQFHSFFRPADAWGGGWTMDLPRLTHVKIPTARSDNSTEYKLIPELSTPLHTTAARFSNIRSVPELRAELLVPDAACDVMALAHADDPMMPSATSKLLFNNGRVWFFDTDGRLVGDRTGPSTTVYIWDGASRLARIESHEAGRTAGAIALSYDGDGRMRTAASADERVSYDYDAKGRLARVIALDGQTSYAYSDAGLVASVHWSGRLSSGEFTPPRLVRSFEYGDNGQLVAERTGDGRTTSFAAERSGAGQRIVATDEASGQTTVATYDEGMRPLQVSQPSGVTTWNYAADGSVVVERTNAKSVRSTRTVSADGRRVTDVTSGTETTREYDGRGRLVAVGADRQSVVRQAWYPDGRLQQAAFDTHVIVPRYDDGDDMRVASVLQAAPARGEKYDRWQETTLDDAGRAVGIKDCTGGNLTVRYDDEGDVVSATTDRDGKTFGTVVEKDDAGRVTRVRSSWGEERRMYDADGRLAQVTTEAAGGTATSRFDHGRLVEALGFDGSTTRYSYDDRGRLLGVETPALRLGYDYGPEGELAAVDLGGLRRVEYQQDDGGAVRRLTARRV